MLFWSFWNLPFFSVFSVPPWLTTILSGHPEEPATKDLFVLHYPLITIHYSLVLGVYSQLPEGLTLRSGRKGGSMRTNSRLFLAILLLIVASVSASAQVEKVAARSARPL